MECRQCHKAGEEILFATFKTRTGEVRRRGVCKQCRSDRGMKNFEEKQAYRKEYNKRNKTKKSTRQLRIRQETLAAVSRIKTSSPCVDCGGFFPAVAMDFDHIKGKNRGIAAMVSSGVKLPTILEEIKLCELVCSNCHRVRTHQRCENVGLFDLPKWHESEFQGSSLNSLSDVPVKH